MSRLKYIDLAPLLLLYPFLLAVNLDCNFV